MADDEVKEAEEDAGEVADAAVADAAGTCVATKKPVVERPPNEAAFGVQTLDVLGVRWSRKASGATRMVRLVTRVESRGTAGAI